MIFALCIRHAKAEKYFRTIGHSNASRFKFAPRFNVKVVPDLAFRFAQTRRSFMTTIKDVGLRAGVTATTVSNVLRGKGPITENTRQRVLRAVEELGYRPNLMAQGLVRGRSELLALLLPDIANPYYPEIALEVENIARERGYQVILCNTRGDERFGRHYLERFRGGWLDGVLAMAGGVDLEQLDRLSQGLPVVLCQWAEAFEYNQQHSPLSRVDPDFERASALAARHLIELGHRHVAAIIKTGLGGRSEHASRLRAVRAELALDDLTLPDELIGYGDSSIEGGRRAGHALLQRQDPPSAVFASNDLMALGMIEAALDAGLRVPEDLSVIGLDDLTIGAQFRPALTTVSLSRREFARSATELLLHLIEHPASSAEVLLIEPKLIVRQSTSPPQKR
jgi:DNA-binding LacI/PurR family transcriptional regulator